MKRSSVFSVLGLIAVLFVSVAWKYERDNVVFTGDAVHDGKTEFNGAVQVDGALTLNSSVTLPSGSIASASLPATIKDSTLISNNLMKVYGSDLVITGTVTVAADAVSIDAVNGITVTAAAINNAGNGATATQTPTLVSNATLKVYGNNFVSTDRVQGAKVYLTATDYFQEIGTTLVYVASSGAATNVLDPDITTP